MWRSGLADKCDRCGDIYLRQIVIELPFQYKVSAWYRDNTAKVQKDVEHIDLCPKCQNELAEWFEKGVNNGKA